MTRVQIPGVPGWHHTDDPAALLADTKLHGLLTRVMNAAAAQVGDTDMGDIKDFEKAAERIVREKSDIPLDQQGAYEQDGDGGITVSAMSDGTVRIHDRVNGYAVAMPPLMAMDVGQRLIAMAALHVKQIVLADQARETKPPKIDLIHGKLPRL